ncbi:MAG: hypothetical protein SO471_15840 [Anaerobutyricum hallii]|uniref:hypothetical protein n=1 Tax=Anaerobutyricum hallii TaxID=39488 RepID=UPI002A83BB5C|nr:hypothetical protein [Anaerobutyricum hallii]MDY4579386.1 hypothetical protein [Anaerobutyricum hallii]
MNHEPKILHKKFIDGEISRREFSRYIQAEFAKLEDELMEGAITPDEHIERYNAIIEKEAEMHAEAFQPREHI